MSEVDMWKAERLSLGSLALECLPGVGGRLWSVTFEGRRCVFQNLDLVGRVYDIDHLSELPTRSPQFKFPLWGGEKTWIAPDSNWLNGAPFPVLDSAPYSVDRKDGTSIAMRSRVCPDSNLQIERIITIETGNSWSIRHSVFNRGISNRYAGIWSVMMLDRPTRIGLNTQKSPIVTSVFGDAGHCLIRQPHSVMFDCSISKEFKSGLHEPTDQVFIRTGEGQDRLWMSCRTMLPKEKDAYAHGHSLEIFNSAEYGYCEVEWHSAAQYLTTGESISFNQQFTISLENDLASSFKTTPSEQDLISCMSS